MAFLLSQACAQASEQPAAPAVWRAAPPLPVPRFEGYAAVAGGKVYFIGGITGVAGDMATARPSPRVDVFDPDRSAWSPGPELPADAPKHHLTVTVPNRVKHSWGNSLLRFGRDLDLEATYTPHDYCTLDKRDVDVAGSSPILLPDLSGTTSSQVIAFGGKAGVIYLLDRNRLAPAGDVRQPCANLWSDAAGDGSLLPSATAEPYCDGFGADPCALPQASHACVRGPLQAFGAAGDDASVDHAKMRSTPAYFRDDQGTSYLFVAGSTKAKRCSPDGTPPSVVRLRVVAEAGKTAELARDAADKVLTFVNPGSPIVTSDGGKAPIVWVVDQNARRTQPLLDPATPAPILYAVDGVTMELLWRSSDAELEPGGKYVTPVAAHGVVYVATDRLHAFAPAP